MLPLRLVSSSEPTCEQVCMGWTEGPEGGEGTSMGGVLTSCVSASSRASALLVYRLGTVSTGPTQVSLSPDFAHREQLRKWRSSLALGQSGGEEDSHWPSKLRSGAWTGGYPGCQTLPRGEREE